MVAYSFLLRKIPRGRAFFTWTPFLLILTIAVGALAVSAGRIFLRARAIHEERVAIEREITELEARKAELERLIATAGSPEVIERLAKERLNLRQPGEAVVIVNSSDSGTATPEQDAGAASWIDALFDFFRR